MHICTCVIRPIKPIFNVGWSTVAQLVEHKIVLEMECIYTQCWSRKNGDERVTSWTVGVSPLVESLSCVLEHGPLSIA